MRIAFIFWIKAVNLALNISKISNFTFLSPFLSLVFIYFYVDEEMLFFIIIALLFIISGLFIQQKCE